MLNRPKDGKDRLTAHVEHDVSDSCKRYSVLRRVVALNTAECLMM